MSFGLFIHIEIACPVYFRQSFLMVFIFIFLMFGGEVFMAFQFISVLINQHLLGAH